MLRMSHRLLVLLMVTSLALLQATGQTASAEDVPSTTLEIRAVGLLFNKPSLTVSAGSLVKVTFINDDVSVMHNFGIAILGVDPTEVCSGPCETVLVFTAPDPGNYQFFCSLHQGMQGDLYVLTAP